MRDPASADVLQSRCRSYFEWKRVDACEVPLYCLAKAETRYVMELAIRLCGQQQNGGSGAFSLAMIGNIGAHQGDGAAWCYRRAMLGCGVLGQLLYLEAEAAGMQGTGFGFYDDGGILNLLGLPAQSEFQVLYNFAIGKGLVDSRLQRI